MPGESRPGQTPTPVAETQGKPGLQRAARDSAPPAKVTSASFDNLSAALQGAQSPEQPPGLSRPSTLDTELDQGQMSLLKDLGFFEPAGGEESLTGSKSFAPLLENETVLVGIERPNGEKIADPAKDKFLVNEHKSISEANTEAVGQLIQGELKLIQETGTKLAAKQRDLDERRPRYQGEVTTQPEQRVQVRGRGILSKGETQIIPGKEVYDPESAPAVVEAKKNLEEAERQKTQAERNKKSYIETKRISDEDVAEFDTAIDIERLFEILNPLPANDSSRQKVELEIINKAWSITEPNVTDSDLKSIDGIQRYLGSLKSHRNFREYIQVATTSRIADLDVQKYQDAYNDELKEAKLWNPLKGEDGQIIGARVREMEAIGGVKEYLGGISQQLVALETYINAHYFLREDERRSITSLQKRARELGERLQGRDRILKRITEEQDKNPKLVADETVGQINLAQAKDTRERNEAINNLRDFLDPIVRLKGASGEKGKMSAVEARIVKAQLEELGLTGVSEEILRENMARAGETIDIVLQKIKSGEHTDSDDPVVLFRKACNILTGRGQDDKIGQLDLAAAMKAASPPTAEDTQRHRKVDVGRLVENESEAGELLDVIKDPHQPSSSETEEFLRVLNESQLDSYMAEVMASPEREQIITQIRDFYKIETTEDRQKVLTALGTDFQYKDMLNSKILLILNRLGITEELFLQRAAKWAKSKEQKEGITLPALVILLQLVGQFIEAEDQAAVQPSRSAASPGAH